MKYLKEYMNFEKLFEKIIDPSDFDMDEWEPNEEEEDDEIGMEYSQKLIGATVYKGTFNFIVVINGNKIVSPLSEFREVAYWAWPWQWRKGHLYDIVLDIKELKITRIDKNNRVVMIPQSGPKRNYSMGLKVLFKGDKLSNYYLRTNDVISFNMNGMGEGLQALYKRLYNTIFRRISKHEINKEEIAKDIKRNNDTLNRNIKKEEEITFLIDNIDKLGTYITLKTLTNSSGAVKKGTIKAENNMRTLNNLKDNILEGNALQRLLKKINDLKE